MKMSIDNNYDSKEKIAEVINSSESYPDLYNNAQEILRSMETGFRNTLEDLGYEGGETYYMSYDYRYNTETPVTIFEKKGKELLDRSRNAMIDLSKKQFSIELLSATYSKPDEVAKNVLINELFETREKAIADFKNDIEEDGVLSNSSNISFDNLGKMARDLGSDMNYYKLNLPSEFNKYITTNFSQLPKLMFGTFNIKEGNGAFNQCYSLIKNKLNGQNLFTYIDSLKKGGNHLSEFLKYSSIKMLLMRKKVTELEKRIKGYDNKEGLLKYIEKTLNKDEDFKIAFLTSLKDLEKNETFKGIAEKVKEDPTVKKAYERANSVEKADIFTSGKVNCLTIYDDEGHGGGSTYFSSEFDAYKNNGYSVENSEDKAEYSKRVLKKGNNTVTLVKIKGCENCNEDGYENRLGEVIGNRDYNLFALRGHCYNTDDMAHALGNLNAVGENDILIDGGCCNSRNTYDYFLSGVKGHIFAYDGVGKGAATQSFLNRLLNAKGKGESFQDIANYYSSLTSESSNDGYFAHNVEWPNSIESQYKYLVAHNENNYG